MFFYRFVDYQQNSNLCKSSPTDWQRTQEQTQLHTVPATIVSAPSNARLCSQMRSSLLPATVVSAPACADSRYWSEAKHCSSLCSQSEGDKYWVAKHGMKIQQSNSPERWTCSLRVRAPHFASKVSYSAGAATDDCASTNLHCKGAAYNLGVQNQEKSLCGFEPNDMAVAQLPL